MENFFKKALSCLVLVLLVTLCHGRLCHVGTNYVFKDTTVGVDLNSGELTSTTCPGENDFCVKMEGSATGLYEYSDPVSGSYTIGYCTSPACSALTCGSAEPNGELMNLKTEIDDSDLNSLTEFASTSCNIVLCSGDDCNSEPIVTISSSVNPISCVTGLSYVVYGGNVLVNNLTTQSCDVSVCPQSCTAVEQNFTLSSGSDGLIFGGLCVPTSETLNYDCADVASPSDIAELAALSPTAGSCQASHCNTDNCNNRTLEDPTTTTVASTTVASTTLTEATDASSTLGNSALATSLQSSVINCCLLFWSLLGCSFAPQA